MNNPFDIDATSLAREKPVEFSGPAGRLEGLFRPAPPGGETRGVAVIAHPHPQYGGTMLNKVVFHTARMLNAHLRLATLRFNFRGVGASKGSYDQGTGEALDAAAAWEFARTRVPHGPLVAGGFSFGAGMTVLAAVENTAPSCLALVGVPLRLFPLPEPFPRPLPAAAVHGEADQYTPPERVSQYLESAWPGPHSFHIVPQADHFLNGHIPEGTKFLVKETSRFIS